MLCFTVTGSGCPVTAMAPQGCPPRDSFPSTMLRWWNLQWAARWPGCHRALFTSSHRNMLSSLPCGLKITEGRWKAQDDLWGAVLALSFCAQNWFQSFQDQLTLEDFHVRVEHFTMYDPKVSHPDKHTFPTLPGSDPSEGGGGTS